MGSAVGIKTVGGLGRTPFTMCIFWMGIRDVRGKLKWEGRLEDMRTDSIPFEFRMERYR